MVQVPAATAVTVLPETVHTEDGLAVNVIESPLELVAVSDCVPPPTVIPEGGLKVIVWLA